MVDIIRSKTQKIIGPRKVYEFGLEFYRDGDPEVHEFKAYPALDAGSLNYTLSSTRRPERAIEGMVRSIRKMLADDDGTPVSYRPERYVPPAPDVDEEESEPDGTLAMSGEESRVESGLDIEPDEIDTEGLYVGPDGEPHDAEFIQKAMKFEAGSSRRRFAYLMDDDEELTLHQDQLQTAYQRLVGKAADRPTRR